jgi:60 kDa SS-A/Ro ribonucleoprotein
MNNPRKLFSTRQTPQNRPILGADQVRNTAGGYAWAVDDWSRLDRFLVLGSEGGTYYIRPRQLTRQSAEAVIRCIEADGRRVVARVVEVNEAGRAPKNDPALFVLAMCAGLGDESTRKTALESLPRVARTGTHLFHFLEFVEGFRGWGRGLRRGVARWYTDMAVERLAYQVVKYQQRDGWSHRDALRLAHPQAPTTQHGALFQWITQGWDEVSDAPHPDEELRQVWAFEQAQRATDEQVILALIEQYGLPWEAIPTQWLAGVKVWEKMLPRMPMRAMLRNLARMTAKGLLAPMNAHTQLVIERLGDEQRLSRARIHPIALLSALKTYEGGQGVRGKLTWTPVAQIIDALDRAFYLSFQNVKSTGKRVVLALDVSGSMDFGTVAGVTGLKPRVASAAMALVTAATESQHVIVAFSHEMVRVNISPRQRLEDVLQATDKLPFGATDCAMPMLWAMAQKVEADAFVIYTDSETWAGKEMHPVQALRAYRRQIGIPAKLVIVGMTSNGFSIADPNDAGMLDVVGFDTAAPRLIADFIAEE